MYTYWSQEPPGFAMRSIAPTLDYARPVPKTLWGPRRWYWLHTAAIQYPAEPTELDAAAMRARLRIFAETLPCPECVMHFTRLLQDNPPPLGAGGSDFGAPGVGPLERWAWETHNVVNRRLGKPIVSLDEYLSLYSRERARRYHWAFD